MRISRILLAISLGAWFIGGDGGGLAASAGTDVRGLDRPLGVGLRVNTGRLGIQYRNADTYFSGGRWARPAAYIVAGGRLYSIPSGGFTRGFFFETPPAPRQPYRVRSWYPTPFFPGGIYDPPAYPLVGAERKIDPDLEIYPPGAEPDETPVEDADAGAASVDGGGAAATDPVEEAIGRGAYEEGAALLGERPLPEDPLQRRERIRLWTLIEMGRGDWDAAEALARGLFLQGVAVGSADPGWADLIGPERLRDHLKGAVRSAHERNRPASWLVVSMVTRAEGREEVADRMLDRAKRRVLERGGEGVPSEAAAGGEGDPPS